MKKLLLAVIALLAAPAIFAQDYYGLQEYGLRKDTTRIELYGGAALPQEGWKDRNTDIDLGKTGFSGGIGFHRNIIPMISVGLDGNYAQLGDKEHGTANYRTGIITGLITGRINFFPSYATRLYIPAGIGAGYMFTRVKEKGSKEHETFSGTDLAQMIGLGLEFDLDEDMIFGVEGRYYLVDVNDEVAKLTHRSRLHYVDILLKFGFRF